MKKQEEGTEDKNFALHDKFHFNITLRKIYKKEHELLIKFLQNISDNHILDAALWKSSKSRKKMLKQQ